MSQSLGYLSVCYIFNSSNILCSQGQVQMSQDKVLLLAVALDAGVVVVVSPVFSPQLSPRVASLLFSHLPSFPVKILHLILPSILNVV